MRKGQVSAFIIIGLVILTIISLVLITINNIQETEVRIEEKIINTQLDESQIEIKIQSCLENTTNSLVFNLAKNGGYLNKSLINQKEIQGISYSKLIDQSEKKFNLSFSKTPEYPCPNKNDITNRCSSDKKPNCFMEITSDTVCDLGFFSTPPKDEEFTNFGDSLTFQLNQAGLEAMENCLQNELESTIQENIKFNTIIQEDNVFFSYQFPVQTTTSRKISRNEIFEYSVPAKLNLIRNIIVDNLAKESKRFNFDLKSELEKEIAKHASLELDYIIDANRDQDTLIKIKDNEYFQNDESFSYDFIVENRPPALNTIQSDAIYPQGKVNEINYYVTVGKYIVIKPQGFDPDDDKLFYTYSGWKADYDEEFNSSKIMNPDIFQSPLFYDSNIEANPKKTTLSKNLWHSSDFYNRTQKEARILLEDKDVGVHEFTVSVSDGVHSDSQLVRVIVGPAPLPIITLRNLLFESANSIDNTINTNDTYISIENPFHLNSNESETSGIGASRNWWINNEYYGSSEKFALPKSNISANSEINQLINKNNIENTVSRDINAHENLIQNIKSLNSEFLEVDEINEVKLQLTLDGSDVSRSTVHRFSVNKCNGFVSKYAMWPFNRLGNSRIQLSNSRNPSLSSSIEVSPFYSDSICCVETQFGFEYADQNTACLNADYEASPFVVAQDIENAVERIGNQITINSEVENRLQGGIGFLRSDVMNDIVKHKFTNFCNGQRGNICSGKNDYNIDFDSIITSCDDDTKSFNGDEKATVVNLNNKELFAINNQRSNTELKGNRCQGSLGSSGSNRLIIGNSCYKYEDETFEEIVYEKLGKNIIVDTLRASIAGNPDFSACNQQIAFACVYNTTNGKTLLNVNKLNNPIHTVSNRVVDGEHKTPYYYEGDYTCGDGFCHKPKGTVSSCPKAQDRCDLVDGKIMFNSTFFSCNENGDLNNPCKANSELVDGYNLLLQDNSYQSIIGRKNPIQNRRYSIGKIIPLNHCGGVGVANTQITRCGAGEVFNGSKCVNVCENTNTWYIDQPNWNGSDYYNFSSTKLTELEIDYFKSINYNDLYFGQDSSGNSFCSIPIGPGICEDNYILKENGQIFNFDLCLGNRVLPNLAAFLRKGVGESCDYNSDCVTAICKDIGFNACVLQSNLNKCFDSGTAREIGFGSTTSCQYHIHKFKGQRATKREIINDLVSSQEEEFEFYNQEIHCPEYDYTLFEKTSQANNQDKVTFLNESCNCNSQLCNDYNDEFGERFNIISINKELENHMSETRSFIFFKKAEQ